MKTDSRQTEKRTPEQDYVDYLYGRYEGRIAIGVGYGNDLSEIFPFVFEDSEGQSIGAIGLSAVSDEDASFVYIYHISAFKDKRGHGSRMLSELCHQADHFQITLILSPVYTPNGRSKQISSSRLKEWYLKFDFSGSEELVREPNPG